MDQDEFPKETLERLRLLRKKFESHGQDLNIYLEGLLHSDYLNYWDYIKVDALLSLQQPRTKFPDEKTFIIYHQITELYFRLIRNSIELISNETNLTTPLFIKQMKRVNKYFRHLSNSFSIMYEGMDRDQFLAFRLALTPASGFQTAQYRIIEIYSTDLINLVAADVRKAISDGAGAETFLPNLYWRKGATGAETGGKSLTLRQFEERYDGEFAAFAEEYKTKNIRQRFHSLPDAEKLNPELMALLREYDQLANVNWRLVHYRTAAFYMERKPEDIPATGGTNWQKYLPPKNQLIMFFPELWNEEEKENWGKNISKETIGI